MGYPIIEATTRVELAGKLYPVENLSYDIFKSNVQDTAAKLPESNQLIPEVGELWGEISFDTQLAGSGTRGTVGTIDYLLAGAGLTQFPVVPATSITYTLAGAGGVGAANTNKITVYPGNTQQFVVDQALCNLSFEFLPGRTCMAHWNWMGLYTEPTTAAGVATRSTDSRNPPICKALTATVGGATLVLKRVLIDLGNTVLSPRSDISGTNGVQAPVYTSQRPFFEVTFEAPNLATFNSWSKLTGRTKIALSIVLGSVSGNIFTFSIDGYQRSAPVNAVADGILEQTISCAMSRESGDQQFQLVIT